MIACAVVILSCWCAVAIGFSKFDGVTCPFSKFLVVVTLFLLYRVNFQSKMTYWVSKLFIFNRKRPTEHPNCPFSSENGLLIVQTVFFQPKMTYWASKLLFFIRKWPTEHLMCSCSSKPLSKRSVWPSVRVNRYLNAPFVPRFAITKRDFELFTVHSPADSCSYSTSAGEKNNRTAYYLPKGITTKNTSK